MKTSIFGALALSLLLAVAAEAQPVQTDLADSRIAPGWTIENVYWDTAVPGIGKVRIRAGYLAESPNAKVFKGNVIYLEGLGDSMMNHQTMFKALSDEGYRVISFDYMGQGGSSGAMNNTAIEAFPSFRRLEIRALARYIWSRYARRDSAFSPEQNRRLVIGWSTGGLAAFQMAKDKWANAVVLIAPGLHPQLVPGDAFSITLDSLACRTYAEGQDPHIDRVRPSNALKVPLFALNLLETSLKARYLWDIDPKVKGLVFLGGQDEYVNTGSTPETIRARAPHFKMLHYAKACHEIQSSHDPIREDLVKRTVEFFNSL